jgi:hypothetical protein
MNLDQVINGTRWVSADYHVVAAQAWKEHGKVGSKQSPLIYSAFEYRCAIERAVLELYTIMHDELPEAEEVSPIGNFSNLIKKVNQLGGGNRKLLYRVLKFNSILSEFAGLEKTLSVPDVGKLHGYWAKLSEYCHRQILPDVTLNSLAWVQKGYELLEEVDRYLKHLLIDHLFGAMPESGMPHEVLQAKRDYVAEKIDEVQLRLRLKLMEPVLERRR